jgi:hypothetical protein
MQKFGCILLIATALSLSAQQPANRYVRVLVSDPGNRIVTGLEPENFVVVENGTPRAITSFDTTSPISIAIVGAVPVDVVKFKKENDELILTPSIADAVRELGASKNARKALIVTSAADTRAVPVDLEVLSTSDVPRAMIELHSQYRLGFSSSDPSSTIDVALKDVSHLPPLKLAKKSLF